MKELVPHLTCIADPSEFEEVKAKGYSEIYVKTETDIFKYMRLKGNRSITTKVKEIPGYKPETSDIKEEINFLPAGKVPIGLLHDIIDFFKQVMETTKQEVEAMAHILWNEKDGYHVAVPNQTISKAAVSYGNDHIKQGDIIILDIHSHNTMGAFFSGTDNNDDKNGVYFSGVVGKLKDVTPALVWRFNIGADKRAASIEDIFEVPTLGKADPAWLSKVEIKTYTQKFTNPRGQQGSMNFGDGIKSLVQAGHVDEDWLTRTLNKENNRRRPVGNQTIRPFIESDDPYDDGILARQRSFDVPEDIVEGPLGLDPDMDDDDVIAMMYGEEIACAKELIEDQLTDLEGKDEPLLDLIKQMHSLLTTEGQIKLATEGI